MRFYLGTHRPSWLGRTDVPLFVSHRTLGGRKTFPRALGPWALDSGGFTELSTWHEWRTTEAEYVRWTRRYAEEIGQLAWAAPQDWMCEPWITADTGLSVAEHQRRTIASVVSLRERAPEIPWAPVLQGWQLGDYERHVEMYDRAGFDLTAEPIVGIGSVCRRQATSEICEIVGRMASYDLRLHGFGVKTSGIKRYGGLLASADSMAWSYGARKRQVRMPGCAHANCGNCIIWALHWRDGLPRPGAQPYVPSLFSISFATPQGEDR